jgi:hypothetical protein
MPARIDRRPNRVRPGQLEFPPQQFGSTRFSIEHGGNANLTESDRRFLLLASHALTAISAPHFTLSLG